ncbi:MAG: hypothetical protein PHI58_03035 [Candidatus Omnitrophica bacterium]|nr:hypothetical protein [Candidatus Omnitrophota bacterium]
MMTGDLLNILGFILATSFAGFNIIIAYDRKDNLSEMEMAGLSYLFGIGAIAVEMFIMGLAGIKFTAVYILLPWVLLAIVNIPRFKARFGKKNPAAAARCGEACSNRPFYGIAGKIAAALLVFVICYAFFVALVRPVESYDAVAIWSLKAKILYLDKTVTPDFLNIIKTKFHGAHSDYPLLLPFSQVWFYTFTNNFNDILVKVLFPSGFLAFLAVFYMFLKKAGIDRALAVIFTFFLASIRQFFNYSTNGYADMQVAVYISVTFLAFFLWARKKEPAYFWTALFSCLFAIWTKNEGMVTLLGFILVSCIYIFERLKIGTGRISGHRKMIFSIICLTALFIAWEFFKRHAGLRDDVVNSKVFAGYDISGIFSRAASILYEYQRQIFGVKYWDLAWIAFILIAAAGFKRLFSGEVKYITIPIFFTLACYTAIYFITPNSIDWQLRTTASRLLIHILPLAMFYMAFEAGLLLNKPPESR